MIPLKHLDQSIFIDIYPKDICRWFSIHRGGRCGVKDVSTFPLLSFAGLDVILPIILSVLSNISSAPSSSFAIQLPKLTLLFSSMIFCFSRSNSRSLFDTLTQCAGYGWVLVGYFIRDALVFLIAFSIFPV